MGKKRIAVAVADRRSLVDFSQPPKSHAAAFDSVRDSNPAVSTEHGKSLRAIAAELGCAVNTVRRRLEHADRPRYAQRRSVRPKLAQFEAYLRERIASGERIPASLLAREIRARGYRGSDRQVLRFVRELRLPSPEIPPAHLNHSRAERLQVDWIEFRRTPGGVLAAFVAVLGRSGPNYVEYVSDECIATVLGCHRRAFEFFGGVPRSVLYADCKLVVIKRDAYGPGRHQFHPTLLDFARDHGFLPGLCQPHWTKTKGTVKRLSWYLRYSFHLPLAVRLLRTGSELDAATANGEVSGWLREVANGPTHGAASAVRGNALAVSHASLLPLPPRWHGATGPAQRSRPRGIDSYRAGLTEWAALSQSLASD